MVVALKIIVVILLSCSACSAIRTTEDRIRGHGYPSETHTVQTSDGYILKMYRIPPKENELKPRPIVFLQHGLVSSSDCWILNGPGQALGYLLSDAGYDVWLGNNRGNTYSKKHAKLSPRGQRYWNFDWHDIGLYDIPTMIDYVLFKTNQTSLHYVGHSQGTTSLFVLTSTLPHYNEKIKSAHLLAPIAYMENVESPLLKMISPLTGQPNAIVELIGSAEFFPNSNLLAALRGAACKENTLTQSICSNMIFLICGWNQESLNATLLEEIFKTHPAGASVNQVLHYSQEQQSGEFRLFDYGFIRNRIAYKRSTPPKYDLSKIKVASYLYYANNDFLANVMDVDKLKDKLSNVKFYYRVPHSKWNHLDLLWGINVKELVFDKVVENIEASENGSHEEIASDSEISSNDGTEDGSGNGSNDGTEDGSGNGSNEQIEDDFENDSHRQIEE